MAGPMVSVVVPVFNAEAHVSRCAHSLLNQTHTKLQIILVDDGSTDSSAEICKSLALQDERVSVVRKPNGGLSDARNAGLAEVAGDFVCFVDSDDWVEPEMIEAMLKPLADEHVDLVISGMIVDQVDDREQLLSSTRRVPPSLSISSGSLAGQMIDDELVNMLGYAWNKLYRTDFLTDHRITFTKDLRLIEDIDFNSRAIVHARQVVVLPEAFVHYLQRPVDSLGSVLLPDFLSLRHRAILATQKILNHFTLPQAVVQQQLVSMGINALRTVSARIACREEHLKLRRRLLLDARRDGESLKVELRQFPLHLWQRLFVIGFFYSPSWIWLSTWKSLKAASGRLPTLRKRSVRWRMKLHSLRLAQKYAASSSASSNPKVYIFLAADYGNLGDLAITEAQSRFLESELPNHEVIEIPISKTLESLRSLKNQVKPQDLITLIGGGNTGDLYDDIEYLRELVIEAFPSNQVMSFPQTIEFSETPYGTWAKRRAQRVFGRHHRLTLMARDIKSARLATNLFSSTRVFEAPDIVLSITHQPDDPKPRAGFVIALRDDQERHPSTPSRRQVTSALAPAGQVREIDTHLGDVRLDQRARKEALRSIWEDFSSAEVVVTDRLHGTIFAIITGTPCVVLNSCTGKVHKFVEDWILTDQFEGGADQAIKQAIVKWDPDGGVPITHCVESVRGKSYIYNPRPHRDAIREAFNKALRAR